MPGKRQLAVCTASVDEANNFVSLGGSLHLAQGLAVTQKGVKSTVGKEFLSLSVEDLEEIGYFGKGSSGSVKKVRHKATKQTFAVKEIKLGGERHMEEIAKELGTLYGSKETSICPYIIDFMGAYALDGSVFIALEAMDGSLLDLIGPNRGVPEEVLACIMKRVMLGLVYLHKTRKLVHRDIKPHNLLYRKDGTIKITDFGVCSELENTKAGASSFVGTVTYMSPERLDGQQYSFSADVWGIGISLIQLATGEHPYEKLTANQGTEMKFWTLVTHLKSNPSPQPKGDFSPEFRDFVGRCLEKDINLRASSSQLLEHPWLAKATSSDDAVNQRMIRRWIETMSELPKGDAEAMSQVELDSALDKLVDLA
eukprot:RCo002970